MKWKGRHTVALLIAIAGTAFYFYFIHLTEVKKELDGWKLRFSYQPFHCRVCLGRVEELTYNGTDITIPNWSWKSKRDESPMVIISTPVGDFRAWKKSKYWGLAHGTPSMEESQDEPSSSELSQGWYDAAPLGRSKFPPIYGPFLVKKNTPSHWCLMTNNNHARWIDPVKIGTVGW